MHIFRYQSALISLALYQIFYAQVVFAKVGGKFNLAVRNETQTEGLKPANCVLENANWCGIELDSYSTQVGCRNASSVCWKQNTDCFNSAGPTGSKNCYIWKAKCKGIEEACNAGNFIGPPDAGKDLTPTLASLVLPAPESTSGVSSYFSESTYSAQTSIASVHPSISSISSSASWIMTVSSSSLHSSMPSSLVNTATLLSSDKTLIPAQPSSSSVPVPNLNITAFFRRDCVVPINGNNSVLVPKGRCSAFGNNTSPNDPIANPIPNGYVSCCYYFGGSFSSVHVLNPDPEAFSSCSLTKFNGYDCDYGGNPETAGTLDIADTCLNTFYNTGAEGAPSNNEPAFAFRVDCIVGNSSSSSAPTPQVKTQSSSSNISSSATLTNLSSKGQDNSHTVPTECHASARPSDTARSLDRPRLVTYVSELEPISETITTVVTFRDYDNLYAPSQYFTVTGPTTIYATITAELKPDRAALANPYKTQASDYCQGICGACSLYFPSVDVLYWPVTSMNTACLGNRTTVTQQASLPSNRVRVREHSLVGAGNSHLVSDGFTFISPSAYLVFSDISAADYCGRRGSDYTSITLAVAPEDLSSIVTGVPYSLNVADLLCPPKSLTESHPWQDSPVSFLGQGYRPIISPPPELLSLDPTWGGCFVDPFQGNDPPRALTPVAAMDPATTRDAVSSVTSAIPSPAPPALPASTKPNEITNPLPTGKSDPPVQSDPASPPHPASSANPPQPSANSQNGDPQQSAAIKSDHKNPQSQNDPQAPEQGPLSLKNGDPQPTLSASTNAQPQPQPSIDPLLFIANPDIKAGHTVTIASGASRIAVGSQTLVLGGPAATISDIPVSLGVGGLVVGSQRGAPQGGPLADPSRATQVVTVNGEVISVGGGVAVMGGTTVSAGAPAITISGKVVSMGDGVLVVGTQTVALPSASSKGSSEWSPLVTVGNQVITAYPTGFAVSGTTLLPGHAGITVAGTPISLDPSGLLIVGTSTRTVGPLISAKPSGFIMDGTTLLPGQAGITISGTPISLNPLGLLVVGTSTLPPNAHITAYPTAFSIDGTTLRPGGPGLTLSGEVLTLESSGLLVVGSSTLSLDPSRSSDAVGLGGLILSGFGPIGGPTGSTTSSVQIFNGAQAKKNVPRIGGLLGLSGISVLGMLV